MWSVKSHLKGIIYHFDSHQTWQFPRGRGKRAKGVTEANAEKKKYFAKMYQLRVKVVYCIIIQLPKDIDFNYDLYLII